MVGPVTHASVGYTEACGRMQSHNREDWSNEENHTLCRSRCTPEDDQRGGGQMSGEDWAGADPAGLLRGRADRLWPRTLAVGVRHPLSGRRPVAGAPRWPTD